MTRSAIPILISALQVAEEGYRTFRKNALERYAFASEAYMVARVLNVVVGDYSWETKKLEWQQTAKREREHIEALLAEHETAHVREQLGPLDPAILKPLSEDDDDEYDPIGPVHGSADDPCPQAGFHFHRYFPDGRIYTQIGAADLWHVGMTVDGPIANPQPI